MRPRARWSALLVEALMAWEVEATPLRDVGHNQAHYDKRREHFSGEIMLESRSTGGGRRDRPRVESSKERAR